MNLSTAILITLGLLAMFYAGMMAYDLYLDYLSHAIKDDDKEEAVDISDQVQEFKSIPVNKTDQQDSTRNRFENLLRAGITAEKADRMMKSMGDGNPAKELDDVMYIIHKYKTANIN